MRQVIKKPQRSLYPASVHKHQPPDHPTVLGWTRVLMTGKTGRAGRRAGGRLRATQTKVYNAVPTPRTLVAPLPGIPQTPLPTPRTLAQSAHPSCTSAPLLPFTRQQPAASSPERVNQLLQASLPRLQAGLSSPAVAGPPSLEFFFFLTFTTQPSPSLSKQKLPGESRT